ncbi:MAG: glycosyltransferase [Candidatus Diapherotrites archaeon]|jgi:mannosylglucosylglycerate synthase|nr:glycosyltransferase [Candidatus Diapherotrites archaeon]MBT4596399.1 glycosyltransferase [Candidatus Diapherotrites archaeon]
MPSSTLPDVVYKKYHKKDIPKLRYAMLHARFGLPDGVSIVMKQIESVMINDMKIPKENIFYLVGKSGKKDKNITTNNLFLDGFNGNRLATQKFKHGFGGHISERIENELRDAVQIIEDFVEKNKIDVILAHNTCHPVNFILAVALSRFYRNRLQRKQKTPKYLLWWHDSHMEREHFANPPQDIERYLLQGIPGPYPEYIFFINSGQFRIAEKYFLQLGKMKKDFFENISMNNDVIYNTTDTFIESFNDLKKEKDGFVKFLRDFSLEEYLIEQNTSLKDTLFCLQHTRIVKRKRIDFALEYCFELLAETNKRRKKKKSLFFFISGNDDKDGSKQQLRRKYLALKKKFPDQQVFLEFAEDYYKKTDIKFEEYPRIFAKLGGFSTYFSEIEGFGNNLLEVLASGLIPVVYTYPVFCSDIEKYNFKLIALDKFEIQQDKIKETIDILKNNRKRKIWVNMNLDILRENFAHKIIDLKLTRGIIRRRAHK